MKKADFCKELADLLELDEGKELTPDSNLKELEEFDSLAIMSIVALADKLFSRKLTSETLQQITTVDSLMEAIGRDCFE